MKKVKFTEEELICLTEQLAINFTSLKAIRNYRDYISAFGKLIEAGKLSKRKQNKQDIIRIENLVGR